MRQILVLSFVIFCASFLTGQKFIDRSAESDFSAVGVNRGVAVGDYDNDGLQDIYISVKNGKNLLYKNLGDFRFKELGAEKGLDYEGSSLTSIWIDVDNDADLDLFIANTNLQCLLYKNESGSFTNVTSTYLPELIGNVQSANVVDFDNDGDLDLYLARFNKENVLLRNENGEQFLDYLGPAGISDVGQSMGAIFFDYDNDGDQDLYQTRDGNAGNLFFRNDGGYFVDATEQTGTGYKGHGMGVDIGDINGDGLMDIYFSNLRENVLYIQNERHSFDQYNTETIQDLGMGWGTLFVDSKNSSNQDIFVANDSHFKVDGINYPNKLIVNRGEMNFFAPPMNPDFQNTYASYGTAAADFDNDGLIDLVLCNAGTDGNQIFQNQSDGNNYLSVELDGVKSNAYGVGARAELYTPELILTEQLVSGHSYASQSALQLHFGLGDTEQIDSLVIYWPSEVRQVVTELNINELITITETSAPPRNRLVWTEPEFPTQNDDIKLFFNAKEGNGVLQGFGGPVYMHAGLITSSSAAPSDWKFVQGVWGVADDRVRMDSEGDDIYSKSYNITDFYGIPPGEVVEQLAFVFRSADGSRAGRESDGGDIFLDVFPPDAGLLVDLISPSADNIVLEEEEELDIILSINKESIVTILDNGTEIFTGAGTDINFVHTVSGLGGHELQLIVDDGEELAEISRSYIVISASDEREDPPVELINGINYASGSYYFQLTAPLKNHVFLLCPRNDFSVDESFRMNKSFDGNSYWIELPTSLFDMQTNTYQYLVDGEIIIADPFSTVVLDPFNDSGVPDETLSELPPYPTGQTTGMVTVFDLVESDFPWTVDDFEKPANTDLVIYELMMRDFLGDQSYKSMLDTLDYLETLGVNAIELMPISEFEGNQSWGYNPSFHMAVDKYYGSKDQLKAVIDACHQRGIAVIHDVVFNHAFSQSPLCQLYWNPGLFRPTPESPYLNETAKHPFNVGYDFNHESAYTKEWVKQVLTYWMKEFRFDGFRFDLSKGLTQTFSGNNNTIMSRFDQSRINILQDYADHIWAIDDDAYVIMEHFADNDEEQVLSDYGMMLWANTTYQFAEAAMGFRSDLEGADYTFRGWSQPHLIAYMESHDEERMAYKLRQFGDASGDYNTRELATGMERIAAASAIYFSIPGPKMLWQFGELGNDDSINRCTNGSVNDNCRLDPKPVRWNYFEDERRRGLYDKLSAMLYLRNNYDVFSTRDFTFSDGNFFLKLVHLNSPDMNVVSMANFRTINSDLNPKFPYTGTWHEYFTGEVREVTDTDARITFEPGEYRIYLSEPVMPPGGFFTSTTDPTISASSIYPNPVKSGQALEISFEDNTLIKQVRIVDMEGKLNVLSFQQSGSLAIVAVPDLLSGMYALTIVTAHGTESKKLVVIP